MIFVFLSGVAGALFGLSYKIRAQLALDYRGVLVASGVYSLVMTAVMALAIGQPLYTRHAVLIGIPYGVSLTLSMVIYFRVVEQTKLNISWTFIQLSVIVPFILSVVAYGERISWREGLGIILIFATILLLGIAKSAGSHTKADRRAIVGLTSTFLLTGLSQCFPKIYQALPGEAPATTILLYASVGMLLSAAALPVRPVATTRTRALTPYSLRYLLLFSLFMSAARLAVPLFLLLALRTTRGAVVFPLRTMINILLVVGISYLFYRERLKTLEALGVPVAVAAITLLTV